MKWLLVMLNVIVVYTLVNVMVYVNDQVYVEKNEQSKVFDIIKGITTGERNINQLAITQNQIDLLDSHKEELSFLNCFYSPYCKLSNKQVHLKTEAYNKVMKTKIDLLNRQYNVSMALQLVFITLLITSLTKKKKDEFVRNIDLTVSELREILKFPLLTEVSQDSRISINKSMIFRINNLSSVSRIILTKNNEIMIYTEKELTDAWLIKVDENKYLIKLEGLPKKVA